MYTYIIKSVRRLSVGRFGRATATENPKSSHEHEVALLLYVPVINSKKTSSFDLRRENRRLSITDSRLADAASVI